MWSLKSAVVHLRETAFRPEEGRHDGDGGGKTGRKRYTRGKYRGLETERSEYVSTLLWVS